MKKLSRRKFILILIASAGAATIGVERSGMTAETLVMSILKAHMPFSNADQSLLMQFAKDFPEKSKWNKKYKLFAHLYFSKYRETMLPQKFILNMQKIEREVITAFVLYSNAEKYFSSIDQTLMYYGMPTIRLCNPFATLRTAG